MIGGEPPCSALIGPEPRPRHPAARSLLHRALRVRHGDQELQREQGYHVREHALPAEHHQIQLHHQRTVLPLHFE